MIDPLITFVLLAAIVAVSIGSAKLVSWCLDRRGESARRSAHEAAFVAQARAELAATGWTPNRETLYQAEIAATKRGDLLAAARYAEEQGRAA
ncbi:hypothetical protein N7676_09690 [Stenotrophomonas sp. GD03993]|uniref:hypothetical protein n=1 Tax=unclassified Stenotrophomonas TaxID=196198 RepID=UPI0013125F9D|nr:MULTISPECIES: hypothetical protein [unclassified Stenotrophomonas]MBH1460799.1 hypothetical protein [Stenotrophomonas maltophilia]MDH0187289.1 hypothetical protein [Stenotrophomonas sp. GD04051]MDH0464080.1 hypothetical protein [Stenotrophomonas sp. GD03993]MDH0877785.1 hypothetical protein [Stenotrophomonas sp. GD03877]MDH2155316.1 hypothetical protein [Stenotrophomonas sp. GD03657]